MPSDSPALPKSVTEESVLALRHWTDELYSFRLTRPASFRFRSGEFVMLGLMVEGKPLLRAYSIASPSWDDGLDFFSIKVPDGPLTSCLQHIREGGTEERRVGKECVSICRSRGSASHEKKKHKNST